MVHARARGHCWREGLTVWTSRAEWTLCLSALPGFSSYGPIALVDVVFYFSVKSLERVGDVVELLEHYKTMR